MNESKYKKIMILTDMFTTPKTKLNKQYYSNKIPVAKHCTIKERQLFKHLLILLSK